MKMYKKIAKIIPIAVLSSSVLFSPGMTFAAEKTDGKLIRNGAVILLSDQANTSSYYPQPNSDPYKEPDLTVTAQTKIVPATNSDFIKIIKYVDGNTTGFYGIKNGQFIVEVNVNGKTKTYPVQSEGFQKIAQKQDLLAGTQFKQEIRWKRIYNRLQPKSAPHQWSVSETHGINKANMTELAYSVGAEVGSTLDGITGKITGSISQKFSTTTTITDQATQTITDTFPAKPDNYPYNDYRVAIYQKEEMYTVIPGENLKQALKDIEAVAKANNIPCDLSSASTLTQFDYVTDELRPIVTPNS
ncbi:hypothetical protein [Bacillus toyonensis]|uniref:Uncharacterized protein n=1 Tax=Bacillus toyonensis TaxID=155322 RepID=A0A2A8HC04_9BACI|nr:hypothetical protein [Bacillus toyonensis]PEQ02864.1 hypothetical protein CN585_19335 [Bacillus toyonensis]